MFLFFNKLCSTTYMNLFSAGVRVPWWGRPWHEEHAPSQRFHAGVAETAGSGEAPSEYNATKHHGEDGARHCLHASSRQSWRARRQTHLVSATGHDHLLLFFAFFLLQSSSQALVRDTLHTVSKGMCVTKLCNIKIYDFSKGINNRSIIYIQGQLK